MTLIVADKVLLTIETARDLFWTKRKMETNNRQSLKAREKPGKVAFLPSMTVMTNSVTVDDVTELTEGEAWNEFFTNSAFDFLASVSQELFEQATYNLLIDHTCRPVGCKQFDLSIRLTNYELGNSAIHGCCQRKYPAD